MANVLVAPLEALTDPLLTDTERRVLLALFSFRGKANDVVWPSTEMLAERANINDTPRISKITTSLANKGWLTKKKKGFTGCNEYKLTFPDRLENTGTSLAGEAIMEDVANLANITNMEENTNTNLANFTKSILVNSTKYKEQTIEQTIEQTSVKKITQKKSGMKTIKIWLHELKLSGGTSIPESDPIFEYADEAGLPIDYLRLAWIEFREDYLNTDKKYRDWRAVFRRAVRGNWKKLWWHDGTNYLLTALGQQGMTAMTNRDKRAAA